MVLFNCAEGWGADWKYLGTGGNGIFWWYDAAGLTQQPGKTIRVWVKKIKAPEITEWVEKGKKVTLPELEEISFSKEYECSDMEIDCAEKTIVIYQNYKYGSKGELQSGESKPGAKRSIPVDSVAEKLYQSVCK